LDRRDIFTSTYISLAKASHTPFLTLRDCATRRRGKLAISSINSGYQIMTNVELYGQDTIKERMLAGWFIPIILATWETEIGRIKI
jgi:hypothetical protein